MRIEEEIHPLESNSDEDIALVRVKKALKIVFLKNLKRENKLF